MRLKIIILILFLFVQTAAQHITICKAFTQTGEPIDIIYSKNISLNQNICILLNAGNKRISGSSVFLYIDKISGGSKQNQFNKVYLIEKNQNWFASNFKFTKEGKFEIYFNDANKKKLASATVIVGNYIDPEIERQIGTNNYSNVEAIFCDKVVSGIPINPKQNVSLKSDGGLVYLYLKSNLPFNTGLFHVIFMRKSSYSTDYDEFVASKKYQLDPSWSDAFFKYKFSKEGDHKISVYDEREKLIKTAYITVVN